MGNLIARRLHARGERVRVLDIWEDASRPKEIEFVKCDIRDATGVAKAMRGVDVVHHNVALVPLTKRQTDEVAEIAGGHHRVELDVSAALEVGGDDVQVEIEFVLDDLGEPALLLAGEVGQHRERA